MRKIFRRNSQKHLNSSQQEYVLGSFASSSALLAQAAKRFGLNSRSKLCLMQFHPEWQHKNCPVIEWYKLQQVSAESTTFRRIQHRRDSDPPFFHEFLLVFVDDGGLYRIERTGQGSRIDALRNIGCMANDYIQYFSADDYVAYTNDKPSELIAELSFPCSFDILDILSICYAIYIRPRTRIYTLQRFNCYFLCGAILLALTRRLVRWEANFTYEKWNQALQHALEQLRQMTREPTTDNPLLQICRLLESDNQEPAGFIIDALHNHLSASPRAYTSLKSTLQDTLLQNTWPDYMNSSIEDHVKDALKSALEGEGQCAKVFKEASSTKKAEMRERYAIYPSVETIYNKKAVDALADGLKVVAQAAGEQYRMEEIEHPNSFLKEIWLAIATRAIGITFPIQMALSGDMEEWGFKDIFLSNVRGVLTAQAVGVMQARRLLGTEAHNEAIAVGRTQSIDTSSTATAYVVQANYDMATRTLTETLKELQIRGTLTVPSITVAIHATLCKNIWDVWLNKSVTDLLGVLLPHTLDDDVEGLVISATDEAGATVELKSVSQYQAFMYQRIEAHANRVEIYHLAAAALVTQDIRNALTAVWTAIPREI
ncbi:hypothetical protein RhiJN_19836 [Ceratobasidium sp. AG-Ba]|nr:hypothetical protein RhiJN_05004 [Ceratobasidium sp. AG-Ba]QRV91818.1 hypothetical protein RhiJN_19836 [Ceratobasidium sp. AG-Ba]